MAEETLTLAPSLAAGGGGHYVGEDEDLEGFPPAFDAHQFSRLIRVEKAYGQALSSVFESQLAVGYAIFDFPSSFPFARARVTECRLTGTIHIRFNMSSHFSGGVLVDSFVSTLNELSAEWLDDPANPPPTGEMYLTDDTSGDAIDRIDLESYYPSGVWMLPDGSIQNTQESDVLDVALANFGEHLSADPFGLRFAIVGTPTLHPFDGSGDDDFRPDGTYVILEDVRLQVSYTLADDAPQQIELFGRMNVNLSMRGRVRLPETRQRSHRAKRIARR